jgi:sulfoxide reductase heme-binding subunit YedZ
MTGSVHTLAALASGPSPLWYATRATGTVSLLLLTATVALGVAAGGRYAPRQIARFEVSTLHRNLSLLSLAFLGLHIATAVADTYTNISPLAAVVPFASSYRPLWVGLGAVALDLLLAVGVTSALRHRLGRRRWKAVHWLAYAAWPVALFHAVGTGTDTRLVPQLLLYAGCLTSVLAAAGWRLAHASGGAARRVRVWALPAMVLVPVTLTAFLSSGPLRPGWAHRAGGGVQSTAPAGTPDRPGTSPPATHQPAPGENGEAEGGESE